jgi:putative transposase
VADKAGSTRGWRFALDPTPSQERLLVSYCGAARFAYNWALGEVTTNLQQRARERDVGVAEAELTPAVSWSKFALSKQWNATKDTAAPWWHEVSMHAFRSGITAAADALKNWWESKRGVRAGRPIGFPRHKSRRRTPLSVSFVEINHQLSWLAPDQHHVRLMLPQSTPDRAVTRRREQLAWIHTVESTKKLRRLVESGRATIQKVTIAKRGGRWWMSFQVRHVATPTPRPAKRRGAIVGVDVGVRHLATLSQPVPGLTDEHGHVANPHVLDADLRRLQRLDRQLARCVKGSKNQTRLRHRRARLHGRITQTRDLHLHRVTKVLADSFVDRRHRGPERRRHEQPQAPARPSSR